MSAIRYLGGCTRACRVLGLPENHCNSCHEDANEGYCGGWMLTLETRAGEYDVCCEVSIARDERNESRATAPVPPLVGREQ